MYAGWLTVSTDKKLQKVTDTHCEFRILLSLHIMSPKKLAATWTNNLKSD